MILIIKILLLAVLSFVVAMAWTPLVTKFLYRWKIGKTIREGGVPIFSRLHAKKQGTPTMGGVIVWGTVLFLAVVFYFLRVNYPNLFWGQLSFLSRSQTLLPLGVLAATALVGLLDDYIDVRRLGKRSGGLRIRHRLIIYTVIALIGAWWFRYKLDWDLLHVPFFGDFNIGLWYVPFFVFVLVATAFSVNESDGLDGLAGGALLSGFGAYAIIAFIQGKYDLAAFCTVIIGALLAFLWFNIHPARFFMGDTGSMSLGITLAMVALLTNSALLLPLIGIVFVMEAVSVILQVFWRKVFHKKLFLSAPFHHHLEAQGWPEAKIVMRLWVIAAMAAVLGVSLVLLDLLFLRIL